MSEILTPDLCVIGAGAGGLSVAAAAAAMGVAVVLVEKGLMGGDCLNYGCVPSKSLIAVAKVAHEMRQAERFAIHASEPRVDFPRLHQHIRAVIAGIAVNDSQQRFEGLGVHVIRAAAHFISRDACEAGSTVIKARRFVVATGSAPALPAIPGLELVKPLTNESLFDLDVLPTRLIVVGGGAVGIEMAQAFRRLGSEVVVLEASRLLANADEELARPALAQLAREGVVLRENIAITRVEPRGAGVRVHVHRATMDETIDGSHLLLATGRRANVEGLGLNAAGVRYLAKGITVGPNLRSSNRRIYAIGDCAGLGQFTHLANDHAGVVLRAILFKLPARFDAARIPHVIFSAPEIASIGLDETEARKKYRNINILRWPLAENDRAQSEDETSGLIKVITDKTGRIIGAGITSQHAGELISLWALAISKRMNIKDVAGTVFAYPTRSEVSRRVALLSYAGSLRNPWLPRLLKLLRWMG